MFKDLMEVISKKLQQSKRITQDISIKRQTNENTRVKIKQWK